jgi:hypothetical protein
LTFVNRGLRCYGSHIYYHIHSGLNSRPQKGKPYPGCLQLSRKTYSIKCGNIRKTRHDVAPWSFEYLRHMPRVSRDPPSSRLRIIAVLATTFVSAKRTDSYRASGYVSRPGIVSLSFYRRAQQPQHTWAAVSFLHATFLD